ncbi:MAG: hypothetical protein RM338_24855 [Nostoc sp. DedQUE12a]|nr:hypothetical protein [Nostoc sp. DedQUE12a]
MNLPTLAPGDIFAVLAIIIALSAYTSVVRQRIIEAIKRTPPNEDYLKCYLKSLSIGDIIIVASIICFVIAWILLIFRINLDVVNIHFDHWLFLGILLFILGLFWLVSLHIVEWLRTFLGLSLPTTAGDLIRRQVSSGAILVVMTILLFLLISFIGTIFPKKATVPCSNLSTKETPASKTVCTPSSIKTP